MKTIIINGGSIDDVFAVAYMQDYSADYIIAADKGMEFCYRNGILPDCIIGDYDSVEPDILSFFRAKQGIIWRDFIPEKDYTDSEIAIDMALSVGSAQVHMLGATGTRLDHVIGNVQLLYRLKESGVEGRIVDAHNRIRMVEKQEVLYRNQQFGKYVSVLPLTTTLEGITLTGFKYPLQQARITSDNTLGISNEIDEAKAVITIERGVAIVIESRD